jgi:hypothetical protein
MEAEAETIIETGISGRIKTGDRHSMGALS